MEVGKAPSGRFKPQIESDAAHSDMASLEKEGLNSLRSPEAREFTTGADAKDCSLMPAKCQNCMEDMNMEAAGGQAPANISNKCPAENEGRQCFIEEDSNGVKTRECYPMPANCREGVQEMTVEETGAETLPNTLQEAPGVNEDHPCSSDNSHAVVMGDSMEGGDAVSSSTYKDNAVRGDRHVAPCKTLNDSEKVEEAFLEEENDGVGQVVERTEEGGNAISSSTYNDNAVRANVRAAPCKALDDSEKVEKISLEEENDGVRQIERPEEFVTRFLTAPRISTKGSSENAVPPPLFLSANESRQHENANTNELGEESDVPSLTNDVRTQNEASLSKGEWPEEVSGATTLISTNLEGWHRFDADEAVNNLVGNDQGSGKKFELWEKLLDDGFETNGGISQNPPLQVAVVHSPFEENQFDLASPGNPFVEEGKERASSFSEADGFARHIAFPSSGWLSQSVEESSSFRWREGPFHQVIGEVDMPSVPAKLDGEMKAAQLEAITPADGGLQLPTSHHLLPSFDAMEPFEAPSFMSLVDPKSHALFEASMPTFQASSSMYAQQGHSGEKWVANFELMAPSTQEITRSSSMPRPGGEASGHRSGQSFSFGTGRDQEPSKNESASPQAQQTKSGFLSPKFSPMVQKVVDKVRTTPAVANGVLNSVRQVVMSPKASDKKETSKSLLSRCVCW